MLYTDTRIMNFGTFMPGGKLLGSNLMIQNITKCEQIIELSVDSTNFRYKIDDLKCVVLFYLENIDLFENKNVENPSSFHAKPLGINL